MLDRLKELWSDPATAEPPVELVTKADLDAVAQEAGSHARRIADLEDRLAAVVAELRSALGINLESKGQPHA